MRSRSRPVLRRARWRWSWLGIVALASASAWADDASIERGEYLTTILGCAGCHTQGAILGNPTGRPLAGSTLGIAYAEGDDGEVSSVVYPANLTPDVGTGLGALTETQIADVITMGIKHTGAEVIPVMPSRNYALLKREDALDIAAFLKSLPPEKNEVPANIAEGQTITGPYVRIGVYLFRPGECEAQSC